MRVSSLFDSLDWSLTLFEWGACRRSHLTCLRTMAGMLLLTLDDQYRTPLASQYLFSWKCLEQDSNLGPLGECLLEFDTCSRPLSHLGWIPIMVNLNIKINKFITCSFLSLAWQTSESLISRFQTALTLVKYPRWISGALRPSLKFPGPEGSLKKSRNYIKNSREHS